MEENEIQEDDKTSIEIISSYKFIFLGVLTFGLYNVWWMYKTWRIHKERDQSDIEPAMRALFALFFLYLLFEKVQEYAQEFDYKRNFSSLFFFIVAVGIIPLSYLPEPLNLITIFSPIIYVPAVEAQNFGLWHDDQFHTYRIRGFSKNQLVLVVIFGGLWIYGTLMLF